MASKKEKKIKLPKLSKLPKTDKVKKQKKEAARPDFKKMLAGLKEHSQHIACSVYGAGCADDCIGCCVLSYGLIRYSRQI